MGHGLPGRSRGLSVIELLVVLAVIAVAVNVAVPAFTDIITRNRLATTTNLFITSLHLARSEAIRTGHHVSICPGDEAGCLAREYSGGWIVFLDPNHDGLRQADERVVWIEAPVHPRFHIEGNAPVARYITYSSRGFTEKVGGAFQAGTVTVCLSPQARRIIISRAGRPRVEEGAC